MNVLNSVKDYVTNVFDFTRNTVSGAIDIIAIQSEDGTIRCTPFHVHFGRIELTDNKEKIVRIMVNGQLIDDVLMKLGAAGEAFFVDTVHEPVEEDYCTSPVANLSKPSNLSDFSQEIQEFSLEVDWNKQSQPEWHDSYRLIPPARRYPSSDNLEKLSWGWGALPTVHALGTGTREIWEPTIKKEHHKTAMSKSDSVYFDAIDIENSPGAFSDHPCMSLCGDLIEGVSDLETLHSIFSDHIVTYEVFRQDQLLLLQNPDLRFLIDGKIYPYGLKVQAHLISRVLFPSSPALPVEESEISPQQDPVDLSFGEMKSPPILKSDNTPECQDKSPTKSEVIAATPTPTQKNVVNFYRKNLHPSQSELQSLQLEAGKNDIEFIVSTAADGEVTVAAKIFLWPISTKIIVAEIDGAISRVPTSVRSLTTMLQAMERDSSGPHEGAKQFFSKVATNGYQIVYLTSRGLSQADLIHHMLVQSDNESVSFPEGPVLLSPNRLLETTVNNNTSTTDFKMAALNGIRELFPSDVNPFYAAFGRTYSDTVIFTEAGVFPGKVFVVDEDDGRLHLKSMIQFRESYLSLLELVDKMFPPIFTPSIRRAILPSNGSDQSSEDHEGSLPRKSIDDVFSDVVSSHASTRSMSDEAYNDVNYWRIKPGNVNLKCN